MWNKCTWCGRFISYADLESGAADRVFIPEETPSNEYENTCKKCKEATDAE